MKKQHILGVCLLLSANMLYGQYSQGPINSYSYALIKNENVIPENLIQQGARAFEVSSKSRLNSLMNVCEAYLKNKTVFYLVVYTDKTKNLKLNRANTQRIFKFSELTCLLKPTQGYRI